MVNGYTRSPSDFITGICPLCILVKSSRDLNVKSAQKSDKHSVVCAGLNMNLCTLQGAGNKRLKPITIEVNATSWSLQNF